VSPVRVNKQGPWRIAIAGGSLGGLSAGVALRTAGYDLQIYERDPGPMSTRGAGIVVQPQVLELLQHAATGNLPMTSCRIRRYLDPNGGVGRIQSAPQTFTSWESIYLTLRAAFPAERYHMGAEVQKVADSEDGVTAQIRGHGSIEVDCLVFADGAQSSNRRRLLPNVGPRYAGYVVWRGVLDEELTPRVLQEFFADAFTFSEARSGGHILVYFIPGANAATAVGQRRLNWVWYVRAEERQLATLLLDREGRPHHASLSPGSVPQGSLDALVDLARREVHPRLAELVAATPAPFLQTIVDVDVQQTVFGQTCLVGDAAFVVRPHTAGATAKAAFDGMTLAASLSCARNLEAGLQAFEREQLRYGKQVLDYGLSLGRKFASA
jgi:2-polyprenyl-6-methoxyphenol hydroxylase-like FAD-dependent oxidoreductase